MVDAVSGSNSLLSQGLAGLQRSSQAINEEAQEIASASTLETQTADPALTVNEVGSDTAVADDRASDTDLAESFVNIRQEQQIFNASAEVVSRADDMIGVLLDTSA